MDKQLLKVFEELPHNRQLDDDQITKLIHILKYVDDSYVALPDIKIIEKTLYHYGGTIASSIVDAIYNGIL